MAAARVTRSFRVRGGSHGNFKMSSPSKRKMKDAWTKRKESKDEEEDSEDDDSDADAPIGPSVSLARRASLHKGRRQRKLPRRQLRLLMRRRRLGWKPRRQSSLATAVRQSVP